MKKHVWTCENGNDYFPSRAVVEEVPSGFYMAKYSAEYGSFLRKMAINIDDSLNVNTKVYNSVKKDFDKFWSLGDKYKDSGVEYKRTVLLHGEPSNGKKYIAKRIGEHFVEKMDGLVLYCEDPKDAKKAVRHIRNVEGEERKILVIIEDLGIALENYGVKSIVGFFKGITNKNGVYIISTTNFEEKIADFISDKPRILGAKFLVDYPSAAERAKYIKTFCEKLNIEADSKKVAKDTDGLSMGHIRNLIESHFLYGKDYEESIEELKEMKENIQSSFYSNEETQNIGFNNS